MEGVRVFNDETFSMKFKGEIHDFQKSIVVVFQSVWAFLDCKDGKSWLIGK